MAESLKVLTAPEKEKELPASGDRPALMVWKFDVARGAAEEPITVELLKRVGNDPPAEGTMVLGDLTQNDYGWRLKLANEGGQRSGGGGQRQAKSPDERRSIERQVSAKVTADLLAGKDLQSSDAIAAAFEKLFDAVDAKIAGGS